MSLPPLRLACVADIHHGPDEGSKQGRAALPLLRRFMEFVNQVRPDAVLELGDRIFLRDWTSDRELLAHSGRVATCICGHLHQNRWAVSDAIPHLALQSLTETWTTAGKPAAAWGLLELDRELRWRVYGNDPLELALPLARRFTEMNS